MPFPKVWGVAKCTGGVWYKAVFPLLDATGLRPVRSYQEAAHGKQVQAGPHMVGTSGVCPGSDGLGYSPAADVYINMCTSQNTEVSAAGPG